MNILSNSRGLFIITIFIFLISLLLANPIDTTYTSVNEIYGLFYAKRLPLTTWIFVFLSSYLALFTKHSVYRIIGIILIAIYTEFLPSYILSNPWLPDQYPYLSEAMWIYLKGRIDNIHYLSEVPALGLLYGIIQIMLNIDFIALYKFFSLLQAVIISLFLASLSKKLFNSISALPITFFALNYFSQINVFHRAALHFTLTLAYVYVTFSIIEDHSFMHWRKLSILALLYVSMVLAYPGSGYILATTILWLILLYSIKYVTSRIIPKLVIIPSSIFLLWYGYQASSQMRITGSWLSNLLRILSLDILNTFEEISESATHPFSTGLTPEFKELIYLRLAIESSIMISALIIALTIYMLTLFKALRKKRENTIRNSSLICIYTLTPASFLSLLPWFLSEWARWGFYKFHAYLLLFSLLTILIFLNASGNISKVNRIWERISKAKLLIALVIVSLLFLVPILRYAPIPYLHVATPELNSVKLIYYYVDAESNPSYYFEYPPYASILIRGEGSYEISGFYWFSNISSNGIYIVTNRALTRDWYYTYPEPLYKKLNELEHLLMMSNSRIFDNGYNRAYLVIQIHQRSR